MANASQQHDAVFLIPMCNLFEHYQMTNSQRRRFLKLTGTAAASAATCYLPGILSNARAQQMSAEAQSLYSVPMQGSARILHTTDIHGQLFPVYFREPNVNLGVGDATGHLPHIVGERFLDHMGFKRGTRESYAYTYLDFIEGIEKYGRMGGFPQLRTLVNELREQAGGIDKTLTMDGGDLWQGSATALWTRGVDMVEASNILGVDVMVGHWEFTYREEEVLSNVALFKGDFIGQNVRVKEDALFEDEYPAMVERFDGSGLYDEDSGHAFQPFVIKEVNGARICVIGQAFPRTANANPQEFFPDWSFGLRELDMIELAEQIKEEHQPDAMVLLSHNGMDVDIKMAANIPGLDAVFGGHTHDGMPKPIEVPNVSGNTCLVTNAGSHGKFLGVMDFEFGDSKLDKMHYRMLPVFENLIEPDNEMNAFLNQLNATVYDENIIESRSKAFYFNTERVGKTYAEILGEKLAIAGETLYRRGNFMGTWDQIICDALIDEYKADISLSAGVRWGTTIPAGHWITMGDMMTQVAITYGETYLIDMKGRDILVMLEGVADNLFDVDPYRQSGGDMVRTGGLDYSIDPAKPLNSRITDARLNNGHVIEPEETYKVAGWASVNAAPDGRLIWDIVRDYLLRARDSENVIHIKKLNVPKLLGVKDNPGLADYRGETG